jgi:hypothetical protein
MVLSVRSVDLRSAALSVKSVWVDISSDIESSTVGDGCGGLIDLIRID